jgi:transcriptional regulator with XRE-family HTH domain
MTHAPEVPGVSAALATRIRSLRDARGWRQKDLADRMTKLGFDWGRTTVQKFETGGRASLSVAELLGLALVFDLPPALLLADPRSEGDVNVADGVSLGPWELLMWLLGAVGPRGTSEEFRRGSWLVQAAWTVAETLAELRRVDRAINPERARELTDLRHREALGRLRQALLRIEGSGAPRPELPEGVYKRAAELDIDIPLPDEEG